MGGYWFQPSTTASAALHRTSSGPGSSGKPWPRLTAPVSRASRDMTSNAVVGRLAKIGFMGSDLGRRTALTTPFASVSGSGFRDARRRRRPRSEEEEPLRDGICAGSRSARGRRVGPMVPPTSPSRPDLTAAARTRRSRMRRPPKRRGFGLDERHRREQRDPELDVGVRGPPPPPIVPGLAGASEREREQKGVERLQGRRPVREIAVDPTLVQNSVGAPDQAPFQTVVHPLPPDEGSAPPLLCRAEPPTAVPPFPQRRTCERRTV